MTDDTHTAKLTQGPFRLPKRIRRLALVPILAVTAFGASALVAPATYAATPPSITATAGTQISPIYVTGSGFTPSGRVTVYVYNSSYGSFATYDTTASPWYCIVGSSCGGNGGTIGVLTEGFCGQTNHVIAYDYGLAARNLFPWSNWLSVGQGCFKVP